MGSNLRLNYVLIKDVKSCIDCCCVRIVVGEMPEKMRNSIPCTLALAVRTSRQRSNNSKGNSWDVSALGHSIRVFMF